MQPVVRSSVDCCLQHALLAQRRSGQTGFGPQSTPRDRLLQLQLSLQSSCHICGSYLWQCAHRHLPSHRRAPIAAGTGRRHTHSSAADWPPATPTIAPAVAAAATAPAAPRTPSQGLLQESPGSHAGAAARGPCSPTAEGSALWSRDSAGLHPKLADPRTSEISRRQSATGDVGELSDCLPEELPVARPASQGRVPMAAGVRSGRSCSPQLRDEPHGQLPRHPSRGLEEHQAPTHKVQQMQTERQTQQDADAAQPPSPPPPPPPQAQTAGPNQAAAAARAAGPYDRWDPGPRLQPGCRDDSGPGPPPNTAQGPQPLPPQAAPGQQWAAAGVANPAEVLLPEDRRYAGHGPPPDDALGQEPNMRSQGDAFRAALRCCTCLDDVEALLLAGSGGGKGRWPAGAQSSAAGSSSAATDPESPRGGNPWHPQWPAPAPPEALSVPALTALVSALPRLTDAFNAAGRRRLRLFIARRLTPLVLARRRELDVAGVAIMAHALAQLGPEVVNAGQAQWDLVDALAEAGLDACRLPPNGVATRRSSRLAQSAGQAPYPTMAPYSDGGGGQPGDGGGRVLPEEATLRAGVHGPSEVTHRGGPHCCVQRDGSPLPSPPLSQPSRMPSRTPGHSPRTFSTLLHSLAKIGYRPDDLWLGRYLAASLPWLRAFAPRDLAMTAWAVALLGYMPPDAWLRALLAAWPTAGPGPLDDGQGGRWEPGQEQAGEVGVEARAGQDFGRDDGVASGGEGGDGEEGDPAMAVPWGGGEPEAGGAEAGGAAGAVFGRRDGQGSGRQAPLAAGAKCSAGTNLSGSAGIPPMLTEGQPLSVSAPQLPQSQPTPLSQPPHPSQRLGPSQPHRAPPDAHSLSILLWALWRLGVAAPDPWLDAALMLAAQGSSSSGDGGSRMTSRGAGDSDAAQGLPSSFATPSSSGRHAAACRPFAGASCQSLALVAYSLARMRYTPTRRVSEALLEAAAPLLQRGSAQDLVLLLVGVAHWPASPPPPPADGDIRDGGRSGSGTAATAATTAAARPVPAAWLRQLCQVLQPRLAGCTAQGLVMSVSALAHLGYSPGPEWLQAHEAALRRELQAGRVSGKAAARVAAAWARLRHLPGRNLMLRLLRVLVAGSAAGGAGDKARPGGSQRISSRLFAQGLHGIAQLVAAWRASGGGHRGVAVAAPRPEHQSQQPLLAAYHLRALLAASAARLEYSYLDEILLHLHAWRLLQLAPPHQWTANLAAAARSKLAAAAPAALVELLELLAWPGWGQLREPAGLGSGADLEQDTGQDLGVYDGRVPQPNPAQTQNPRQPAGHQQLQRQSQVDGRHGSGGGEGSSPLPGDSEPRASQVRSPRSGLRVSAALLGAAAERLGAELPHLSGQELGRMVAALSALGVRPPRAWLRQVLAEVGARLRRLPEAIQAAGTDEGRGGSWERPLSGPSTDPPYTSSSLLELKYLPYVEMLRSLEQMAEGVGDPELRVKAWQLRQQVEAAAGRRAFAASSASDTARLARPHGGGGWGHLEIKPRGWGVGSSGVLSDTVPEGEGCVGGAAQD